MQNEFDPEPIETLLHNWQPQPSKRLSNKEFPWHNRSKPMKKQTLRLSLATMIVLISLIIFVPSWRNAAAQMLGLQREASDQVVWTVTYGEEAPSNQSIATAEQKAGFDLLEPSYIPTGFEFESADYWDIAMGSVIRYVKSGVNNEGYHDSLNISQTKLADNPYMQQFPSVGASAEIQTVTINGVQGQYVKGAWYEADKVLPEPGTCDDGCVVDAPTPGTTEDLNLTWNNNVNMHRLIWRDANFQYTIDATGEFTPAELVQIAESLH